MRAASRIAHRLGLDGNPLRRRIDRAGLCGTAALLAVFAAGAPAAAVAVGHAVARAGAAEQHDQRTWRMVQAVLLQDAPISPGEYDGGYDSWTSARWTTPAGREMEGMIEAQAGAKAGTRTPIWIYPSGRWAGLPLSLASARLYAGLAIAGTVIVLAAVLAVLSVLFRRWLDRRRLAGWEASWNTVGPRWTEQFRTRGL